MYGYNPKSNEYWTQDDWGLDHFRSKFNRKPKVWGFKELQELYVKTIKRKRKYNKLFHAQMDKMLAQVTEEDRNGNKRLYYRELELDGSINGTGWRYFDVGWDKDYKCRSWSQNWVDFKSGSKEGLRNEKLEFLLSMDDEFVKEGNELSRLYKLTHSRLLSKVQHQLFDKIFRKLRSNFEKSETRPTDIIKIEVAGQTYYVKCRDTYGSYLEFEMVSYNETPIIIE